MLKITLLTFLFLFIGQSRPLQAQNFPTTYWHDLADTSWYIPSDSIYYISSAEELAGISALVLDSVNFEHKHIELTADINLKGHLWTPIGYDLEHSFSGTVDGQNHTISHVLVNQPTKDFGGLFGSVLNASFKNIVIDSATIYSRGTTGGLVANLSTNSTVENCHVFNGYIHCESGQFGGIAGGLVGGLLTHSSISKSSFSGEVHGGDQIGGLVGTAWDDTVIETSYAEGLVSGENIVGGLVGYTTMNFPPVPNTVNVLKNSYSRANVIASGIIAGGLYAYPQTNGKIINCYSTGTVQAGQTAGGSIGSIEGQTTVLNTYFDTETSGMTTGLANQQTATTVEITAKTTAEMTSLTFVSLLNAQGETVWSSDASLNDGYPILVANNLSVDKRSVPQLKAKVYPTLVHSEVTVQSAVSVNYKLYDLLGKLLKSNAQEERVFQIPMNELAPGIYLLQLYNAESSLVQKIIRQ